VRVSGVLETVLYCGALDAAERFYAGVLGLERIGAEPGRHLFLRCGSSVLLLFRPDVTARVQTWVGEAPIPLHGAVGAGHVAFRVEESELDAWRVRLAAAGFPIESEVRWPGGAVSLYVRDPAGNSVEVAPASLWGLPERG
jgi:catechol 2,3-dioxygenase-like lactoylglutathione lyase family enzyme